MADHSMQSDALSVVQQARARLGDANSDFDSPRLKAASNLTDCWSGQPGIFNRDGTLNVRLLGRLTHLQHFIRELLPNEPYAITDPYVLYIILDAVHKELDDVESSKLSSDVGSPVKEWEELPLAVYAWIVGVLIRILPSYPTTLAEKGARIEKATGEKASNLRENYGIDKRGKLDLYRERYLDYLSERLSDEAFRDTFRATIAEAGLLLPECTQPVSGNDDEPPPADPSERKLDGSDHPSSGAGRRRRGPLLGLAGVCVILLVAGVVIVFRHFTVDECKPKSMDEPMNSLDWGPREARNLVTDSPMWLASANQYTGTSYYDANEKTYYPNLPAQTPPPSPPPQPEGKQPSLNNVKIAPLGAPPDFTGIDLRSEFVTVTGAINSDIPPNRFDREIQVRPDGIYMLRIFIINTAQAVKGLEAKDVSFAVHLPTCPSASARVVAQVSSSNADPKMVWGSVTMKADRPFVIEPVKDQSGRICSRSGDCQLTEFNMNLGPAGLGEIDHPEHAFEDGGLAMGSFRPDGILLGGDYVDILLYVRARFIN